MEGMRNWGRTECLRRSPLLSLDMQRLSTRKVDVALPQSQTYVLLRYNGPSLRVSVTTMYLPNFERRKKKRKNKKHWMVESPGGVNSLYYR